MTSVFLGIINIGIAATYVLLAVLLLRFCLKKAPKGIRCLLWSVLGLRLLLPFSLESPVSLLPSAQTIPVNLTETAAPQIHSGISAIDTAINPGLATRLFDPALTEKLVWILCLIWFAGIAILALYALFSSISLYRKVRVSICLRDNIYICDDIESPFILGILRPRIYLPAGMDESVTEAVIAHETAHILRKDHFWKPLGYIFLTLYWFHPGIWLGYILLCRDIEMACDEKAIRNMDSSQQRRYSEAILACSVPSHLVNACPLAFGETGVKDRIKAILSYKKPALWLLIGASLLSASLAICFLTDPQACQHTFEDNITLATTCSQAGIRTFTCLDCGFSCTDIVPTLNHDYNEIFQRSPTCTQEGERRYICTHCGDERTEPIPVVDHQVSHYKITKEPNCTQDGEKWGNCNLCGQYLLLEVLPKNDQHKMVTTVTREASCTETGLGKSVCSLCQKTETVVYDRLRHNYELYNTVVGTCVTPGSKTEICTICKDVHTTYLSLDPDYHEPMPGFYVAGYCSGCGQPFDGRYFTHPEG